MLTSLYPWNEDNRVYTSAEFMDTFVPAQTLPGFFKANGYSTYGIGRIFETRLLDESDARALDQSEDLWTMSPYDVDLGFEDNGDEIICFDNAPRLGNEDGGGCVYSQLYPHTSFDEKITQIAMDIFSRHDPAKPFLLIVGFTNPSAPLESRQMDMNMQPPTKLPGMRCYMDGR